LLVIWSATGILLEVPSGALADAYSRRGLLVAGPLLTATGYALWVFAPSYVAFAAGFVLWGAKGALASGALEALVYEELDRHAAAEAYPKLTGRAHTVGVVAVLVAIAAASPVLAAGGYAAIGLASVAACVLTSAVAATFPEHRPASDQQTAAPERGYVATLRAGLAEARTDPQVRPWLLLVPAITAVWGALEEYAPLLIRETGVSTAHVPLYYLLIWGGVSAGGLLAAAGNRLSSRGLATLLAAAALAMASGALSGYAAGIALVAAAFAAFQVATVVADTRLQDSITGPGRATVTSVASLATDGVTILVYGAYAALAPAGHGTAFAVLAVPYLVVAVALRRKASHEPTSRRVYLMKENIEPGDGS
jgi:MFS family permease